MAWRAVGQGRSAWLLPGTGVGHRARLTSVESKVCVQIHNKAALLRLAACLPLPQAASHGEAKAASPSRG